MTRQQKRAAERRAAKGQEEPVRWKPKEPVTEEQRRRQNKAAMKLATLSAMLGGFR